MGHRTTLVGRVIAAVMVTAAVGLAQVRDDPLPSWNDGAAKRAITGFVARVTAEGGKEFVRPEERLAVFDNDGTLWCEQPMYFQAIFALDRVKAMAGQHPEWREKEPFRSVLAGDTKGLAAAGEKGLLEVVAATHTGMTTVEFSGIVEEWLRTARHPRFDRPYTACAYQPMLEVLAYLRASGFQTYIVSGGGAEFMRAFAERTYGIPPQRVVGSCGVTKFELRGDGRPVLMKEPRVLLVDDGPGKPEAINTFIGRRPILCFGNSDGDLQMLQYTTVDGPGGGGGDVPRLGLIVHHTDAEREYAYDRRSDVGRLDKALDEAARRGWVVVDMKADWRTVFPWQQAKNGDQ